MGNVCACQDGLLTSFEQPSAHSGLPWRSVHSLIITFCMIEVVKLVQIEEEGKRGMTECDKESSVHTHTHTHLLKYTRIQTSGISVYRDCLVNSNITGWSIPPLLDVNQIEISQKSYQQCQHKKGDSLALVLMLHIISAETALVLISHWSFSTC